VKRRLFKLAITLSTFLLIGIITTVIVSWIMVVLAARDIWITSLIPEEETWVGPWPTSDPTWEVAYEQMGGLHQIWSSPYCNGYMMTNDEYIKYGYTSIEKWMPSWAFPRASRPESLHPTCNNYIIETASGWPLLALYSSADRVFTFEDYPPMDKSIFGVNFDYHRGISSSWLESEETELRHTLPLKPLWIGFVLDSVIYGAMWGLLFLIPIQLRQFIRYSTGRCRKCGYNLKGSSNVGCLNELKTTGNRNSWTGVTRLVVVPLGKSRIGYLHFIDLVDKAI